LSPDPIADVEFTMSYLAKPLLTLIGLILIPIGSATAAPLVQPLVQPFVHGCGTGCSVTAELISPITKRASLNQGTFRQQIKGGQGGNKTQTLYGFADCATKRLALTLQNRSESPASDDEWLQLDGTRQDYTTVAGGRGFYFEALCAAPQPAAKPASKLAPKSSTPPPLNEASRLGTNGLGPVLVGMTRTQAEQAAGRKFTTDPITNPGSTCTYGKPIGIDGIGFMLIDGKVARTDVWKNTQITTLRGAKIGDSEARIKSLYGSQITVKPHPYVPTGHYLVFTPKDQADRQFRVIFETDGQKVTRFRSGQLPEVEYIEGCS
jgi:hypothetical protein